MDSSVCIRAFLSADGTYHLLLPTSAESCADKLCDAAAQVLCCDSASIAVVLEDFSQAAEEDTVRTACRELREQMMDAAARLLGCAQADLLFERQGVRLLWTGQVVTPRMVAHTLGG